MRFSTSSREITASFRSNTPARGCVCSLKTESSLRPREFNDIRPLSPSGKYTFWNSVYHRGTYIYLGARQGRQQQQQQRGLWIPFGEFNAKRELVWEMNNGWSPPLPSQRHVLQFVRGRYLLVALSYSSGRKRGREQWREILETSPSSSGFSLSFSTSHATRGRTMHYCRSETCALGYRGVNGLGGSEKWILPPLQELLWSIGARCTLAFRFTMERKTIEFAI